MPYVAEADGIARPVVDLEALAREQGPEPWRLSLVGEDGVRAVLLGWPPGFRTIPHMHPAGTELFEVRSGTIGFRRADAPEVEVGAGAFFVARPAEFHGLRVIGEKPAVLLAIVGPNDDRPDEAIEDAQVWPDWTER